MFKRFTTKQIISRLAVLLMCLVAVTLPMAMVATNPVEADAASSQLYKDLVELKEANSGMIGVYQKVLAYDTDKSLLTYSDAEILACMEVVYDICVNDRGYTTGDSNYKNCLNIFKKYYQVNNHMSGTIAAGTYNVGGSISEGADFIGVAQGGCTISSGTVTLNLVSDFFTMRGTINVTGGKLIIQFADNYDHATQTGSNIKSEIEGALQESDGIVRAGSTDKTGLMEQFSGQFFNITGGEVEIKGHTKNSTTYRVILSGAAAWNYTYTDTGALTDEPVATFPYGDNTGDDVESKYPVFYVTNNAKLTLNYVTVSSVWCGAQRSYDANGNKVWTGNTSAQGYGCFAIDGDNSAPTVTISNSRFQNIYGCREAFMRLDTDGGSVSMTNTLVQKCYSSSYDGDGVYTRGGILRAYGANKASLSLKNCTFSNNYSERQTGAIAWGSVESNGLTIDGCTLEYNVSRLSAGAIQCASVMNIIGSTKIRYNRSVKGKGGAIVIYCYVSSTENDTLQLTNDANVTINSQVQIVGNKSYEAGGAINMKISGIKTGVDSGNYRELTEKTDGTPYSVSLYIKGATIKDNKSYADSGGAVYMTRDNNDPVCAGYIAKMYLESGTISNNQTPNNGGAFALSGNGVDFIMTGGTVSGNTASNQGGAVAIYSGGNFEMRAGTLTGNSSGGGSGGAAYVADGTVTITGGTISSNSSGVNGGALNSNGGSITISGANITGNTAVKSGGAIYANSGSVTITNATISENGATGTASGGGGVYVANGGSVTLNSGDILNNYVSNGSGGAFSVNGTGTFTMKGGLIEGNTASASAAGVRVAGGNFIMNGGTINNNTAEDGGAAVMVDNGGSVTVTAGTISNNVAKNASGGGIYVNGGNVSISGGEIIGNSSLANSGGGIYLANGDLTLSSGTVSRNSAADTGGGIYVASGSATIGVKDCLGNAPIDGHPSCPVISNNTAANGGGIAVIGGSPTVYCADIIGNEASKNGGGLYVENGNVSITYGTIESNTASQNGGGIAVLASTTNVEVDVFSGTIRYNNATNGAGILVQATGTYSANIEIGASSCIEADPPPHSHPHISNNTASNQGGGLSFVSSSDDGIVFIMYCGVIENNVANGNIPTGNILQEGGSTSIYGDYSIENATISNGTYLRPTLGTGEATILYHYDPDGVEGEDSKTTRVTVVVGGDDERMFINMPSAPEQNGLVLLRWELKREGNTVASLECGQKYLLNSSNVNSGDTIEFYAVWLVAGAGYAEPPVILVGEHFEYFEMGNSFLYTEANNPFTVRFSSAEVNPFNFSERTLSFNEPLVKGTSIILIDFTQSGTKGFYYYIFEGDETKVKVSDFIKMGSPGEKWTNTVSETSDITEEKFLFVFNFDRTEIIDFDAIQITFARDYKVADGEDEKAPLTQVASCSFNENDAPALDSTAENYMVGEPVTFSYTPGVAALSTSVYYDKLVSLVISSETALPEEAYITDGVTNYTMNSQGYIIVPLGNANAAAEKTFTLIAPSLVNSGAEIELMAELYMTVDAERPLEGQMLSFNELTLSTLALPSATISMENRVFYYDNLPGSVEIILEGTNLALYSTSWSIYKLSEGEYRETDEVILSVPDAGNPTVSFDNVTESGGTYRVTFIVSRENGEAVLTVPYNFVVLSRSPQSQ